MSCGLLEPFVPTSRLFYWQHSQRVHKNARGGQIFSSCQKSGGKTRHSHDNDLETYMLAIYFTFYGLWTIWMYFIGTTSDHVRVGMPVEITYKELCLNKTSYQVNFKLCKACWTLSSIQRDKVKVSICIGGMASHP